MPDRSERFRERLLATFRLESADHVRAIRADLAALDGSSAPEEQDEHLQSLFRTMHTLKGAARSVGAKTIEEICQECESALRRLTQGAEPLTAGTLQRLKRSLDAIVHELSGEATDRAGGPAPSPGSARPTQVERTPGSAGEAGDRPARAGHTGEGVALPRPAPTTDQIRVEVGRLDSLVYRAETLLTPRLSLGQNVAEFKAFLREFLDAGKQMQAGRQVRDAAGATPTATAPTAAGERMVALGNKAKSLLARFETDYRSIRTGVDELFAELKDVRMMPVANVIEAFPDMVQDIAGETGKNVEWQASGTGLELDRKVLEFIKDPLIHLVRNAIDHGVEPPAERVRAGKPERARVSISFSRLEGGKISIVVADDGRGIDVENVREAASRLRLVDAATLQEMSDDEARDLIFRSGLSTSAVISAISGHGLGLSVVRERVERLAGTIRIRSEPGRGTTATLVVPESRSTFSGLLVAAGGSQFLFPRDTVLRAIRLDGDTYRRAAERRLLKWDDVAIPFGDLSAVLDLSSRRDSDPGSQISCVVADHDGQRAAFAVDEVVGDRECLVKEFQWPLARVPNISAVGLLGSGDLSFILRPSDLFRAVHSVRPPASAPDQAGREAARPPHILVVDDSLTTRTMERHLFESAGFRVSVAPDGVEAWNLANSETIDLVVSDIDMPRMDGFELTARLRASPRLAELPVVLVTALEAREDKERGLRVGANAYVLKSTFDQSNLLEVVRRLL